MRVIEHFKEAWNEMIAPGGGFAMVETEVRGVPMRVFEQVPPNMRAIWELATLQGDKDYLVFEDERLTYNETAALVRALAHHLVNDHGVGSGDRVAIAMRNYPEWVISYWAIASIGAAAVGMNAWWTGPEMEFALDDSRPKVLIADSERIERVADHLPALRANADLALIAVRTEADLPDGAAHWNDVIDPASAPDALPDIEIDPDDDVTIFYTSGTTGFPKGAQLTHRGSVHNLFNIAFMQFTAGAAAAKAAAAMAVAIMTRRVIVNVFMMSSQVSGPSLPPVFKVKHRAPRECKPASRLCPRNGRCLSTCGCRQSACRALRHDILCRAWR